ncbi:MAG TPA: hypothetical protein V6C65_33355, partial [Allocoleopsis sp.]
MKIQDALILGVLGLGVPLLLSAATLYSRATCQIDQNVQVIKPIGYKSDLQWLFIAVAVAQGVVAWQVFKSIQEEGAIDVQASPVQALPESTAPVVEFAPPPVTVKAELELAPALPQPVFSYQPQPPQQPIQRQVEPPQPQPQPTKQQMSLIRSLAQSHLSIVFSAPPGTGKTTTELAWMGHVLQQFPDALMFIACWKNDAFLGLSTISGAVAVLGDVDDEGALNWQPLLRQINKVFEVLRYRRNLTQEKRSEFQGKPVWLVLADYYATVNTLSQSKKYLPVWE